MGRDQANTVTGRTETTLPSWHQDAAKKALTEAQKFYAKPFTPYTDPRVAPLSADTTAALGKIRDLQAPTASYERIVDENGRLGAVKDYLNPHTDAVLAPAIRNIETSGAQERLRIGEARHNRGAYGDARHGMLENENAQATQTAIGDVTARTHHAAYDTAMGQRAGDLSRFTQADQTNFTNQLQVLQSQLAAGTISQQQYQNELDARFSEFMRAREDEYNRIAMLTGSISGTPTGQSSTTYGPRQYPLLQAAGSIAGAILPFT